MDVACEERLLGDVSAEEVCGVEGEVGELANGGEGRSRHCGGWRRVEDGHGGAAFGFLFFPWVGQLPFDTV